MNAFFNPAAFACLRISVYLLLLVSGSDSVANQAVCRASIVALSPAIVFPAFVLDFAGQLGFLFFILSLEKTLSRTFARIGRVLTATDSDNSSVIDELEPFYIT